METPTERNHRERREQLKSQGANRKLISTVQHTGTHSLVKMYPDYVSWHCSKEALNEIDSQTTVLTTWRDPKRVAASWHNRDQLKGHEENWRDQWTHYAAIKPIAKVMPVESLDYHLYQHNDKYRVHAALDNEEMSYYYSQIDRELIEFAEKLSDGR